MCESLCCDEEEREEDECLYDSVREYFEWWDVCDEFEVDRADSPPDVRGDAEGEAGERVVGGGVVLDWGWWCHGILRWVGVCDGMWGTGAMLVGDANS